VGWTCGGARQLHRGRPACPSSRFWPVSVCCSCRPAGVICFSEIRHSKQPTILTRRSVARRVRMAPAWWSAGPHTIDEVARRARATSADNRASSARHRHRRCTRDTQPANAPPAIVAHDEVTTKIVQVTQLLGDGGRGRSVIRCRRCDRSYLRHLAVPNGTLVCLSVVFG
jgi:hypothetical protein